MDFELSKLLFYHMEKIKGRPAIYFDISARVSGIL